MIKPSPLSINKKKSLVKLHQKKYRQKLKIYLCEGFNLFQEAIKSEHTTISEIIISKQIQDSSKCDFITVKAKEKNIPVYFCSDKDMQSLCEEKTPQGVVFTSKMRLQDKNNLDNCEDNAIVYFEKISDPGNLGTIIRTMNWFGMQTLLLSPDCVDPFNGKTVRSSAGAIFEAEIYEGLQFPEDLETFKKKGYNFIATTPKGGISLDEWNINCKNIIFFGPETAGLSEEIIKLSNLQLTIQKRGNIESLNLSIAAGIILSKIANG